MGKVLLDISVSLDGFAAGPDTSDEHPLGVNGGLLHEWIFADNSDRAVNAAGITPQGTDAEVAAEVAAVTGATVIGRRMFDVGAKLWGDVPYPVPCFVLTHEARPAQVEKSGTFTFVTDGIESAVRQAQDAAGDKSVLVMGGPDIIHQALYSGLVDEIQLHVVPVLLGCGVRLFDGPVALRRTRVVETPAVTHLRYDVLK